MKRLSAFFISCFFLLLSSVCIAQSQKNPYIPNKINIWIDKEFLRYYQNQNLSAKDSYKSYSTETNKSRDELIKELIELMKLQLKTNLILIRQNDKLIKLLEQQRSK